MIRRFLLLTLALAALAVPGSGPAQAADPMDEIAIGDAKAKVTIVEYFSMTCSHCADFHVNTLPKIKADWVATGKVRFVFKDFPLDQVALRGAMLSRCLAADKGPETYARFVELLMKSQSSWAQSKDPMTGLDASARLAGMSKERIDTCAKDKALEEAILEEQIKAQKAYGIRSTPSFLIGGKLYPGAMPYDQFTALLKEQ
ncbi:MAG: DsbA family protein [Rhodospirillales bacterium]|nr:MAG: DsbA family protein [Rhodospirillales bacterium]